MGCRLLLMLVLGGLVAGADVTGAEKPAPPKAAAQASVAAVEPAQAFAALDRLPRSSEKTGLSKEEKALIARGMKGKWSARDLAEAALLASGVKDAAHRNRYLKRLDSIEQQARKKTGHAKNDLDKAKLLLQFLHDSVMTAGYESRQFDLAEVLDTGKFNCVGSATLYHIIGTRLGLDLCIVVIKEPAHMFCLVNDGDSWVEIEATNPRGYYPKRERGGKHGKMPTDLDPPRREFGSAELVSDLFTTYGSRCHEAKRYREAVSAQLAALALDPANRRALVRGAAQITGWGNSLTEARKHREALQVLTVARRLYPEHATIRRNALAAYQNCARSHADQRDWENAARVCADGLREFPNDPKLAQLLKQSQASLNPAAVAA